MIEKIANRASFDEVREARRKMHEQLQKEVEEAELEEKKREKKVEQLIQVLKSKKHFAKDAEKKRR